MFRMPNSHNFLRLLRLPAIAVLCSVLMLCVLGVSQTGVTMASVRSVLFQPASQASQPTIQPHFSQYALAQPPPSKVDCTKTACLALTFDDGPNSTTTPIILDALARHQARASFFVVGSRVAGHEQLLRQMFYAGHEIGNHSWSHKDFTEISPAQIQNEINSTQAAIASAGVPTPTLFRPPYGAVNETVRSNVPLTIALWNVDPLDWKAQDVEQFKALLLQQARPGGVLDLHDIYDVTAHAVDSVITELQKHYTLVTFSELLNLQPGQPGQFYGR